MKACIILSMALIAISVPQSAFGSDTIPPEIISLQSASIVHAGRTLTIVAEIQELGSGVSIGIKPQPLANGCFAIITGPQNRYHDGLVGVSLESVSQISSTQFAFNFEVAANARPGKYTLQQIELTDNEGNHNRYYTYYNDKYYKSFGGWNAQLPVLSVEVRSATFENDIVAPILKSLALTSQVSIGREFEVTAEITDDNSDVTLGFMDFRTANFCTETDVEWGIKLKGAVQKVPGLISLGFNIGNNVKPGQYNLCWIEIADNAKNKRMYSRKLIVSETVNANYIDRDDNSDSGIPVLKITVPYSKKTVDHLNHFFSEI